MPSQQVLILRQALQAFTLSLTCKTTLRGRHQYLSFTDEGTQAQIGQVTCPSLEGQNLTPRLSGSKACVFLVGQDSAFAVCDQAAVEGF